MSRFMIGNIVFALAVVGTLFVTTLSSYECKSGHIGVANSPTWLSLDAKINKATAKAIRQCEKNSKNPENCFIVTCQTKYFQW